MPALHRAAAAEMMLLDEATGSVRWRSTTPHTIDSEISATDLDGRQVVIAGASGSDGDGTGGFAVEFASGALIWQNTDGDSGFASNVVDGVLLDQLSTTVCSSYVPAPLPTGASCGDTKAF